MKLLACIAMLTVFTPLARADDYRDNPAFKKKMEEAKNAHKADFTAAAYRKAWEISGKRCEECLLSAIKYSNKSKDYAQVIKTATDLEKMPAVTPRSKSQAETFHGMALVADPTEAKPADLLKAESLYKQAIADDPENDLAYYREGIVLAALKKDAEASAMFHGFVEHARVKDKIRARAIRFEKDPQLSLTRMAPFFRARAIDGKEYTSENLRGRVVVLAFVRTDSPHYKEAIVHLQRIAAQYQNDPFTMISVFPKNNGDDATRFAQKYPVSWAQVADAHGQLFTDFNVTHTPTYVILDAEGVVASQEKLAFFQVDNQLRGLIAEAKQAKAHPEEAGN